MVVSIAAENALLLTGVPVEPRNVLIQRRLGGGIHTVVVKGAGPIGGRPPLEHSRRCGIDAALGNRVVGKYRSRGCRDEVAVGVKLARILDGRRAGNDACLHRRRRHGVGGGGANRRANAFVAAKEEQLVFFDRTADGSAELVLNQDRPFQVRLIGEEVVGIEDRVAQKIKSGAMKSIGSALGHHGDDAVGRAAKFRSDRASFDAELLDGVLRGDIGNRVDIAVIDGSAVDEFCTGVGDAAGNLIIPGREAVAVHSRYGVAGLGSALGNNSRRKREKIEHIPAIQR